MILLFFITFLIIGIPIALVMALKQGVTDTKIRSVKQCEVIGKKVVFKVYYQSGKCKLETVKLGSPRWTKLRGFVYDI